MCPRLPFFIRAIIRFRKTLLFANDLPWKISPVSTGRTRLRRFRSCVENTCSRTETALFHCSHYVFILLLAGCCSCGFSLSKSPPLLTVLSRLCAFLSRSISFWTSAPARTAPVPRISRTSSTLSTMSCACTVVRGTACHAAPSLTMLLCQYFSL